jgi:hypothetical protein
MNEWNINSAPDAEELSAWRLHRWTAPLAENPRTLVGPMAGLDV